MNFLSLFVLIPLLMLLALVVCRNIKQVHTVSVVGSGAILVLSAYLVFAFLGERAAGNDAEMLYTDSVMWFAPLNIHYAVGVDGISVAMLLLSAHNTFYRRIRFMDHRKPDQGILHVAYPAFAGRVRLLHIDRPVHDVHVL